MMNILCIDMIMGMGQVACEFTICGDEHPITSYDLGYLGY